MAQVVGWYAEHQRALFGVGAPSLRAGAARQVAAEIKTLAPDCLLLASNGITLVAKDAVEIGTEADSPVLLVRGVRVVNGVQTILALADLARKGATEIPDVLVTIRIVVSQT